MYMSGKPLQYDCPVPLGRTVEYFTSKKCLLQLLSIKKTPREQENKERDTETNKEEQNKKDR